MPDGTPETADLEHLPMLYAEIVDEAMRNQEPVTEVRDVGEHRTIYRAVQYDPNTETVWRADIDADEHPEYDNDPNVKFAKCYPTSDLEMMQKWTSKATGSLSGPQKLPAWESMFTVFNTALRLYKRKSPESDKKLVTDGGQPVEEENASSKHDVSGRLAHDLDLICDGCGSTSSDVRLVRVEDPDGIVTTCESCEPQLRSTIVEEIDNNSLVADGGEEVSAEVAHHCLAEDCEYEGEPYIVDYYGAKMAVCPRCETEMEVA